MRGIKRSVLGVLAGLGIGVVLWLISGVILDEAVLHARRSRPPGIPFPPGVQARWRAVEVTARDGAVLKGWLLSPPTPNRDCVIALHGIADSRGGVMGLARLFVEHHYIVLAPDNRGQGESGGDIVTYGLLESDDLHRCLDLLMSSEHPRNVFAIGESLGASVLLQALPSEHRLSAVVAECPFANFERVGVYRVAQRLWVPWRIGRMISVPIVAAGFAYARLKYGLDFRAASPENAIDRIDTPVLLIHGLNDMKTPAAESRVLAARNPRDISLWLVPGASHVGAFAAAPDEFKKRVLEWFSAHARM